MPIPKFISIKDKNGVSRLGIYVKCPDCGISRFVRKSNFEKKPNFNIKCFTCSKFKKGINAGSGSLVWKGGRRLNSSGYIDLWVSKDNPLYSMASCHGYVLEHRYLVAKNIGRILKRSEHVHHLNGIKIDNRLKNLVLLDGGIHKIVTALEQKIKRLEKEINLLKGEK
jgi:ribosomal protein S27E